MSSALARTTTALGLAVAAALALPAGAASAETAPEAERTAWFNAASGGGLAAPQPSTSEGDLRVARAVQPQAFSALLYTGDGVRASLDLTIRDGSVQGTPDVVACPTVETAWEDGGNQPMDVAPEYDCEASTSYGLLSEDGTTLTFGLDGAFQVEPGTWSIALVPTPGGVSPGPPPTVPLPFMLDLEPPAPGAFVLEEEFAVPAADEAPAVPAPASSDAGFAPTADLGALPADSGPLAAALPAVAAPAPEAAAPAAPAPVLATAPLAVLPASHAGDEDAGRRLLALLALAGGSAAVGYAAGQQRPGPRLIGGRARIGGPAAAGAVAALPLGDDRPRGIGRFAKIRDEAPRRLR